MEMLLLDIHELPGFELNAERKPSRNQPKIQWDKAGSNMEEERYFTKWLL